MSESDRKYCSLTQEHWEEYRKHQGYAFIPEQGPDYPDKWKGPAIGEKRGIYCGSNLVSVARLLPTEININGIYHPTACVADVATMPENRGKGNFKLLFKELLSEAVERGMYLSVLWPSSYLLYKKLGFKVVGTKRLYSASFRDFELDMEQTKIVEDYVDRQDYSKFKGSIFPVEFGEEVKLLGETYREATKKYNLSVNRTQNWWQAFITEQSMLSSGKSAYVYAYWGENGCEGYVIYHFNNTFSAMGVDHVMTMNIREMVFTTDTAYHELLKFVSGHNLQADYVEIEGLHDDFFQDKFMYPDKISCRVYPGPMMRITDVGKALNNLPINSSNWESSMTGEVTIRIIDDFMETNSGSYIINLKDNALSIKGPLDLQNQVEPDITMSVGSLSQLYIGYTNIYNLLSEPDVITHFEFDNDKEVKLNLLNKVFAEQQIFSLEYF